MLSGDVAHFYTNRCHARCRPSRLDAPVAVAAQVQVAALWADPDWLRWGHRLTAYTYGSRVSQRIVGCPAGRT